MRVSVLVLTSLVAIVLGGCATMGGLNDAHTPQPLEPVGVKADSPAVVHLVLSPDSPVHNGDTILSVNGKPVTAFSFYRLFTPQGTMKVKGPHGKVRTVADSAVLFSNGKGLKAHTFKRGGTFVFPQKVGAYHRTQDAAFVMLGHERGLISASLWHTKPEILELYIQVQANQRCGTCSLDNVAVMDWGRKAWLTPVPFNKVAWVVYPPDTPAGPLMNVPPPTPVGYTSTTTGMGTANGSMYGNTYTGTYSGFGTTTTTPYYNYTATNMALAYNLGTVLKQDRIMTDNRNRREFVADRISNLKSGHLLPGEIMTGYVGAVVPNGFTGPYVVAVKGAGKIFDVRFNVPGQ